MSTQRRALTQRGGPTTVEGDESLGRELARAWDDASTEPDDTLTHGFHAYPARMHNAIARHLLRRFGTSGARLLDPFCGSGTTMIEGMIAGLRPTGIDLNTVALRVAAVKCDLRDSQARDRFTATLDIVVNAALDRVRERVPIVARLSADERSFYSPHTLKELAGLKEEIDKVQPIEDRQAFEVLLSAVVVKFSNQRADTTTAIVPKSIGKGLPSRFFRRKGFDLLERWAALADACAPLPKVHRARFFEADARTLDVLGDAYRADLILSSPPYGGTYDYADHHARRYAWLGLSPTRLRRDEIGARRHLSQSPDAVERWNQEMLAVLQTWARVLAPDGLAFAVIGDAKIDGRPMCAATQWLDLGAQAGLQIVARASQPRHDWDGGPHRREHLIVLKLNRHTSPP